MFLILLPLLVYSEIIASSQIEKCYQSSTNSTNTDCAEKMLISLTVDNSQNISTDYIKITQTTVDNETLNLKTPVVISITKTPVYAYYPLKYQSDYNSKPKEVSIGAAILSCDDSWYSSSPTCGFQYSNGTKIFDSQGFCCSCGILDLIGLTDNFSRGTICKDAGLSSASMAFCLRYSNLWYRYKIQLFSAYSISTYSYYYNITVTIKYSNGETENLQLGSSLKVAQGSSLIARIVGDFTPLNPPPSLESFYLMKPTSPSSHATVQSGSSAYMIVSKDMVGTGECNKIGVSYTAFRSESDSCKKQVGSCLKNQLTDLYQADLGLLGNNTQPNYLISRYGKFTQVYVANDTYLQYSIEGSMNTLITLEIDTTGRISYITNIGVGKIDFAEVQNFVAKSGSGLLYAQVTNTGDIASEFSTFLNCSINVIPITSVSLYLDPLTSQVISQDINVLSDMNKSNKCNFSLLNNKGTLLDWKEITFNTTEIIPTSDQNHDEQIIQDNESDATNPQENNCTSDCSVFFDISCYIMNSCDDQIITFFTVLGCSLFLLICCCTCFSYKKQICCCCRKKKNKSLDFSQIKSYIKKSNIEDSNKNYNHKQYYSALYKPENKIMYLNLAFGADPVSDFLEYDISIEVLVTIQSGQLLKIQIKKTCNFVEVFKQVYGGKHVEENIKKYLEAKRETIRLFSNFLTATPLFSLL